MKRAGILSCIALGLLSVVLIAGTGTALAAGTSRSAATSVTRLAAAGPAQISAGYYSGYAIKRDGSLWSWGANSAGELGLGNTSGLGDTESRLVPHRVGKGTSWKTLAAGEMFCLALKRDGSLWAWGSWRALGLGDPPYRGHPRPTRVGTSLWRAIGAGGMFGAGIQRDGSLWTWGKNGLGQLGLGSPELGGSTPTQVGSEHDWKTMAVGDDFMLAIKNDGSLWSWGGNEYGQLGIGTINPNLDDGTGGVPHPTPTRVGIDNDWRSVAAGQMCSVALKKDGSLWAWGGIGSRHHLVPARVRAATDWKAIAAGEEALALKRDGTLWAWGWVGNGQSAVPTRVGKDADWRQISAGDGFNLAIKQGGSVWAWGSNGGGELGLGDRRDRSRPTRIVRLR
jgi:trimeric autotransporter adhesin